MKQKGVSSLGQLVMPDDSPILTPSCKSLVEHCLFLFAIPGTLLESLSSVSVHELSQHPSLWCLIILGSSFIWSLGRVTAYSPSGGVVPGLEVGVGMVLGRDISSLSINQEAHGFVFSTAWTCLLR